MQRFSPARFASFLPAALCAAIPCAPAALAQSQTQLFHAADPGPGAAFGNAVSTSGELACIGAWLTDPGGGTTGAASVFRRLGASWSHVQDLPRPGAPEYVLYGCDVSISSSPAGEVAAVGAPFEYGTPLFPSQWTGAVFVFRNLGGNWTLEQKLVPSDGGDLVFFGFTVGAAQDLIVVGAPNDDPNAPGSGSVYVYRYDPGRAPGARWFEEARALCPPEVQYNQQFGGDVSVDVTDGVERFVAGAHDTGVAGLSAGAGTVYRNVGGTWQVEAGGRLVVPEAVVGDPSFTTTALDGNVVLLGTSGRDVGALSDAGAVWAYRFDGSAWRFEQKLVAADGAPHEGFGRELAVHGDLALVAAPWHDWDGVAYYGSGANHLFRFDGTRWLEYAPKLEGAPGDGFVNPTILGSHALVGALAHDVDTGSGTVVDAGAVYAFELSNSPAGADVVVQPVNEATGAAPVTLAFAEVLAPGATSVVVSAQGPPPPSGFQLGSPPTYLEISTTAVHAGAIELCIDYSGVAYGDESKLRLLHHEGGIWVDVTTTLDVAGRRICGSVSSLSPFLVAELTRRDVVVDIKPGSYPNAVNLGANGHLPIAILSSADFDATTVDPLSVTLASAAVALRGNGTPSSEFVDVNADGLLDLRMQVEARALALSEHDTQAVLMGSTFDGQAIQGSDSVRIVP